MALVAGLFFTGRSTCCAQDKYLQVTSDSSLAFKLAMSDTPLLSAAPPGNPWPASYHLERAGLNMVGSIITSVIASGLIIFALRTNQRDDDVQTLFIISGFFTIASVSMRLVAATHLTKAGRQLGTQ